MVGLFSWTAILENLTCTSDLRHLPNERSESHISMIVLHLTNQVSLRSGTSSPCFELPPNHFRAFDGRQLRVLHVGGFLSMAVFLISRVLRAGWW